LFSTLAFSDVAFSASVFYPIDYRFSGSAPSALTDGNGATYWDSVGDYYGNTTAFSLDTTDYLWVITTDNTYTSASFLDDIGGSGPQLFTAPDLVNSFTVDGETVYAMRYLSSQCTLGPCGPPVTFTNGLKFAVGNSPSGRMYGFVVTDDPSVMYIDDQATMYSAIGFSSLVNGCTDTRANNYNPLADNEDYSCTYTQLPSTVDMVTTPSHPLYTTTITTPRMYGGSNVVQFHYGFDNDDNAPYWVSQSATAPGLGDLTAWLMGDITSTRKYLYTVGDQTQAPNFTRNCASSWSGDVGILVNTFTAPSGRTVYVKKYTFFSPVGACVRFSNMAVPSGFRLYSMISSSNPNLSFASWSQYQAYVGNLQYEQTKGIDYLATTTPLGECTSLDIGCYISNGLQYVFTPDPQVVAKFRSLTLASSSPFSYAYDMGVLREELFETSTTTQLSVVVPFPIPSNASATISLISKSQIEAIPFTDFIKLIITSLLWIMLASTMYYQILNVHNKEHNA